MTHLLWHGNSEKARSAGLVLGRNGIHIASRDAFVRQEFCFAVVAK